MERLDEKRRRLLETLHAEHGDLELLVEHVMTTQPVCFPPATQALEIVRLMQEKHFRHVLVIKPNGTLLGVISDRDLIGCRALAEQATTRASLVEVSAADLMSTNVVVAGPLAPLGPAVANMIEHGISCLPVLADEKVIGIVTNTDLHIALQVALEFGLSQATAEPSASMSSV